MTVEEKLRAMEDIWTDLRKQPGDIPSPDWHREVLDAREQKRKDGSSVYDDWSVAKERIRKKPDEDRRQDPDRIQKRI